MAARGVEPVVFDNLVHGHRWAVRWGPFVEGDLADGDLIRRVLREHRVTEIIHFAAHIFAGESMTHPSKYFRNNVANTLNLLDAMVECGVRDIIFSSTAAVYGAPIEVPIPEEHPQLPVNPYGESKLAVERILRWYAHAYGIRYVALRYFNASGADPGGEIGEDHHPETHLIPLAIDSALGRRGELEVYGTDYDTPDGTAVRDYIHVNDLAEAHRRALVHLAEGGESSTMNLGTGRGHSVREILSAVERVTGRKVPLREAPRRPGDPPVLVADSRRAKAVLRWQPTCSDLDTIVGDAARWQLRLK
jgi:UDP-glucose-4-epimerase GalE